MILGETMIDIEKSIEIKPFKDYNKSLEIEGYMLQIKCLSKEQAQQWKSLIVASFNEYMKNHCKT